MVCASSAATGLRFPTFSVRHFGYSAYLVSIFFIATHTHTHINIILFRNVLFLSREVFEHFYRDGMIFSREFTVICWVHVVFIKFCWKQNRAAKKWFTHKLWFPNAIGHRSRWIRNEPFSLNSPNSCYVHDIFWHISCIPAVISVSTNAVFCAMCIVHVCL